MTGDMDTMRCPSCQQSLNHAFRLTGETPPEGPQEGAFTICGGCAMLLVFGPKAASLLYPSEDDLEHIRKHPSLGLFIEIAKAEVRINQQRRSAMRN